LSVALMAQALCEKRSMKNDQTQTREKLVADEDEEAGERGGSETNKITRNYFNED
jgi:hypothetical protein